MTSRIDLSRIRKLCEAAEKLGYKVQHVHADVLKDPAHACVKIRLQQREKK